jgi:dihydroorotase
VASHCEDLSIINGGIINKGETSAKLGVKGMDRASEDYITAREMILASSVDARIHICHVSTEGSAAMIRFAKSRGVKVTCETCPHYFTLTDKCCETYDTNFKMHPPLRTEEHKQAIIEGIKDGTIDVIATDNAPHHQDEKDCEFAVALNGILGFETAFALGYTYLVKTGEITLTKLIDLMCFAPSNILKLGRGGMNVGDDADLAVFDLDNEFVFEKDKMLSKSRNTPYDGYKLYGETILTVMGGKITYEKLC